METITLTAQARTAGKTAKALRREKLVPCVLYGFGVTSHALQVPYKELLAVYRKAGESTLVQLTLEDKTVPTLVHDIDFDPLSGNIAHVDFYAVDMKKETEAHVPVHLTGEAPAVKNEGGVVVTVLDHVTVRCLPADLPHNFTLSLASLEVLHSSLYVKDLVVPAGVRVLESPGTLLVTIQEPRRIIEETPAAPVAGEAAPAAEGQPAAAAATEKKTEAAPAKAAGGKGK